MDLDQPIDVGDLVGAPPGQSKPGQHDHLAAPQKAPRIDQLDAVRPVDLDVVGASACRADDQAKAEFRVLQQSFEGDCHRMPSTRST